MKPAGLAAELETRTAKSDGHYWELGPTRVAVATGGAAPLPYTPLNAPETSVYLRNRILG